MPTDASSGSPRSERDQPLRAITDRAHDSIFCKGRDLRYTFVNPAMLRLLDCSEADVVGKTAEEVFGKEAGEIIATVDHPVLDGATIDEIRDLTIGGEIRTYHTIQVPLYGEQGEITGICGIVRDVTERHNNEKELIETREKYVKAFQTSVDSIAICSMEVGSDRIGDGRYLEVNDAFLETLGLEREDVIGRTAAELGLDLDPATRERIGKLLARDGVVRDVEVDLPRRNGEHVHGLFSATPIELPDGKLLLTMMKDISRRKEAEDALLESEQKYRALFELSQDAILVLDEELECLDCNPAGLKLFGLSSRHDLSEFHLARLSPELQPDGSLSTEKAEEMIQKALDEGTHTFEWTHRDTDGREFPTTVQATTMILGGRRVIQGTIRDTSERYHAEDVLRIQRDLSIALGSTTSLQGVFSCILEHLLEMPELDAGGVYRRDPETGRLDLAAHQGLSPEFTAAVAHYDEDADRAELIAEGIPTYLHYSELEIEVEDTREREQLRAIAAVPIRHEEKVLGALILSSHSRDEFPDNVRNVIESVSGTIGGAIARALAETALHESQARLRQSEKMQAIGELAGGIAHDFNNQLTGIMGYADLIRGESTGDGEIARYAENILTATRRAADLTSQLLAFARKGRYLSVPVNIHSLISEVVVLLQRSIDKRISIEQHLGADPSSTTGDPTQLQSALLNLALNARDAMPEGGELTFTTETTELDALHCSNSTYEISPGRYLRVDVTDTGMGMDGETRKRIFEPFFTTKEQGKGTGMGLAAVYGSVKIHQGEIIVKSEPGQGATITLFLPLSAVSSEDRNDSSTAADSTVDAAHILLVDDEELVCEVTSRMLERMGYRVTRCSNGVEAVDQFLDAGTKFDLVILDMVMPGLNGRDTFEALKGINPDVAVLLSSGHSIDGDAQQALDDGARGFLQKPYRGAQLSRKVAEILSPE